MVLCGFGGANSCLNESATLILYSGLGISRGRCARLDGAPSDLEPAAILQLHQILIRHPSCHLIGSKT